MHAPFRRGYFQQRIKNLPRPLPERAVGESMIGNNDYLDTLISGVEADRFRAAEELLSDLSTLEYIRRRATREGKRVRVDYKIGELPGESIAVDVFSAVRIKKEIRRIFEVEQRR